MKVKIKLENGFVEVISKPVGIEIEILDYDIQDDIKPMIETCLADIEINEDDPEKKAGCINE